MNPNTTNNFFGIKVSKPGINVANASDKQLVYKNDYTSQTWYDNLNPRIIEGKLPNGDYGLWISKPGFDVTSPHADTSGNLVFNSNQDTFKIVVRFTGTIVPPNTWTTGQVVTASAAHNLGFTPAFMAFVTVPTTITGFTPINPLGLTSMPATITLIINTVSLYTQARTDNTNIYLDLINMSTGTITGATESWLYTGFLLQETAN